MGWKFVWLELNWSLIIIYEFQQNESTKGVNKGRKFMTSPNALTCPQAIKLVQDSSSKKSHTFLFLLFTTDW